MATSVTSRSITWTFDGDYTVGQYVNGDYWVVGPVGITAITQPHATAGRDGSTVNPVGGVQGYDSRNPGYSAAANASLSLPLTLSAGESLVSTISWESGETGAPSGLRPRIRDAAVLTCVSSAQAANAFRPAYCGTTKTVWTTDDVDLTLLPSLPAVASTPTLATMEARFDGPWLDHGTESASWSYGAPSEIMPDYGRDIATQTSEAALMLMLDEADIGDKTDLAYAIVQIGIDKYGEVTNGAKWTANGGHGGGRKIPILLAGKLLSSVDMLGIGTAYPASTNTFGEDAQTFIISSTDVSRNLDVETAITVTSATASSLTGTVAEQIDGYTTIPGNIVEITSGTGSGQRREITGSSQVRGMKILVGGSLTLNVSPDWDNTPDSTSAAQIVGYESDDIGTAEWGVRHATMPHLDNPSFAADYRLCCTATATAGAALAARWLGLQTAWGHDAFFDYQDRYNNLVEAEYGSTHYFRAYTAFMREMWDTYRATAPSGESVTITPAPLEATASTSGPTVISDGDVLVVPAPITATASTSGPTVIAEDPDMVTSTIGTGGDYATLTDWQTARKALNSGGTEVAELLSAGSHLTSSFTMTDGWAAAEIIIRPASGNEHGGIPGAGIVIDPNGTGSVITIEETTKEVIVDGLEITNSAPGSGGDAGIKLSGAVGNFKLRNLLIHDLHNTFCDGIWLGTGTCVGTIENCAIWDNTRSQINCEQYEGGARGHTSIVTIKNVTLYGGTYGLSCRNNGQISTEYMTVTIYNSLLGGASTGAFGSTGTNSSSSISLTAEDCIADDASLTTLLTTSGFSGLGGQTNVTESATFTTSTASAAVIFESLTDGSEDFHLTAHANNLATYYGDSANAPADDWEGDTRDPDTTGFTSAGADEIGVGLGSDVLVTPPLIDATASTGGPTVLVSGGVSAPTNRARRRRSSMSAHTYIR